MSNPEMMDALQALAVDKGISVDTLFAALADALESAYKRLPEAYEYAWVAIDPDTLDFRVIAQELDEEGEPTGPELDGTPPRTSSPRRAGHEQAGQRIQRPSGDEVRGVAGARTSSPASSSRAAAALHPARPRSVEALLPRPSRHRAAQAQRPGEGLIVEVRRPPRARRSGAAPTRPIKRPSSGARRRRQVDRAPRRCPPKSRSGPNDGNVDPVGACGARGARVVVVNELGREDHTSRSATTRRLREKPSPAKVKEVRIHEDTGVAEVIVPDYQLSLAIARRAERPWPPGSPVRSTSERDPARRGGGLPQPGLGRGRMGHRPRQRRADVDPPTAS